MMWHDTEFAVPDPGFATSEGVIALSDVHEGHRRHPACGAGHLGIKKASGTNARIGEKGSITILSLTSPPPSPP